MAFIGAASRRPCGFAAGPRRDLRLRRVGLLAILQGMPTTTERRRFRVRGVVQGVGFRPCVYALARRHELGGFVLNDGEGVLIEAEGGAVDRFAVELVSEAPPLARIASLSAQGIEP